MPIPESGGWGWETCSRPSLTVSGGGQRTAVERLESPRSEHSPGRCALCEWRPEWEVGGDPAGHADLRWAAHTRLTHPVMADWLASRRSPRSLN